MNVKIVAVTQPRIEGVETAEEFVAYAARVSNPANQLNSESAPKLLKYLLKHQHWSPFEMAHVVMEIETTRDIARQILRHRSFAFQEFSQRYALATELGFEFREARLQDPKNRQASLATDDVALAEVWEHMQEGVLAKVKQAYTWAISNGLAKEQARAVLPEGMTGSRLYMSGSLRSWIHYIMTRKGDDTQKEHRDIARQALACLEQEFPSITNLVNESN